MSIKLIPYIRRRVPGDVLLDEFYDSLEKTKEWFESDYNKKSEIMTLDKFEYVTLSMTMDGIHWRLLETSPDDVEWYDYAFDGLKEFFGKLIRREYNKLIEKHGLLPLNESIIPTETEYLGWDVPRELYDELDKIGVKRYDKENDKIYIAELHFDDEVIVFEILDLYGEIYDNIPDVPVEYSSYHKFKIKDLPKKVKRYISRRIIPKWVEYFQEYNQKSSLNEDLKDWSVSDSSPKKNKYKMGPLDEEEDFEEDYVLRETKIQKAIESYIEKTIKDKKLPESFLKFKTFTLDDEQTPRSGSKLLYVFPIFKESFGNTPYEEWEIIEKLLWSENGLHTKLEAAFTGFFDKVYMKSPKTPETYIKVIKSLSKFGNRI